MKLKYDITIIPKVILEPTVENPIYNIEISTFVFFESDIIKKINFDIEYIDYKYT